MGRTRSPKKQLVTRQKISAPAHHPAQHTGPVTGLGTNPMFVVTACPMGRTSGYLEKAVSDVRRCATGPDQERARDNQNRAPGKTRVQARPVGMSNQSHFISSRNASHHLLR